MHFIEQKMKLFMSLFPVFYISAKF